MAPERFTMASLRRKNFRSLARRWRWILHGPTMGRALPQGWGHEERAKADPTHAADVVIAYRYLPGLSLCIWMELWHNGIGTGMPIFSTMQQL
jgi:hypothetical protein